MVHNLALSQRLKQLKEEKEREEKERIALTSRQASAGAAGSAGPAAGALPAPAPAAVATTPTAASAAVAAAVAAAPAAPPASARGAEVEEDKAQAASPPSASTSLVATSLSGGIAAVPASALAVVRTLAVPGTGPAGSSLPSELSLLPTVDLAVLSNLTSTSTARTWRDNSGTPLPDAPFSLHLRTMRSVVVSPTVSSTYVACAHAERGTIPRRCVRSSSWSGVRWVTFAWCGHYTAIF